VLLFAGLRESCGDDVLRVDLPLPTTVAALRAAAEAQFPTLVGMVYRIAIDQRYANDDAAIGETAEVAFLPPVSGG
jgi:molybdopterin converting factor small subunit